MTEITDAELITVLKKNNFKVTPQRLAICKLVLASKEHPTAEMIFKELEKEYPTISPATVYKTLILLKEIGLITELNFHNEHSRFDPNTSIHVNIICPVCNKISDYRSNNIIDLYNKITSEIGGQIIGQRFDIYKKCSECK